MNDNSTLHVVRVFRYDPAQADEGHFDTYELDIPKPEITTILDVLFRILKEQDSTLAFRYACRVNMCGSCGLVINGREGLACKTNVSDLPKNQDITIRPLNHFPIIKDLMVDMSEFFAKYEDALPFFEPKEKRDEPCKVLPSSQKRIDIGMATDCIACGCCVSSCTMVNHHEGYAGPAALNRAFTLLADERDALFEARLTRALDSCYNCRTEFNCTEVCPKQISGTRAIKYIQRLALKNLKSLKPIEVHPAEIKAADLPKPQAQKTAPCSCHASTTSGEPGSTRRNFVMGSIGVGCIAVLGGILGVSSVSPTLDKQPSQWVDVKAIDDIPKGKISELPIDYVRSRAFFNENIQSLVLIRHDNDGSLICFSNSCPHLGCAVTWDKLTSRFKCACHGGAFDRDGKVVAGPPQRPLPRFPYKIENGILKVEVV